MAEAKYSFRVDPSPAGGWTVWYPDLPGCMGWAERWDEIGVEARTVAELWLESEHERWHPIPAPYDYASDDKWPQGKQVEVDGSGPVIGVPAMATLIGVSVRRVQAIAKEREVGRRFGNYLLFTKADIELLRPRPPGRPKKLAEVAAH